MRYDISSTNPYDNFTRNLTKELRVAMPTPRPTSLLSYIHHHMKHLLLSLLLFLTLVPAKSQDSSSRHNMETAKQLDIFNSLYSRLDLYYVDSLSAKKNIENAINYMLNCLDPYTEYYSEGEQKNLKQMTTGQYAGIGAVISYRKELQRCIIADPYEHLPAQESGLRIGDIILKIDGKAIEKCSNNHWRQYSDSVSNALRGKPGTICNIEVQRYGHKTPLNFKIKRRRITLPSVSYFGMLNPTTGYISLNSFTRQTTPEMRHALTELRKKGMLHLILDLRNNGGGLLEEAVNVVGMFVPKGSLVASIRSRAKELDEEFYTHTKPIDRKSDIIVLTNGGSASAAEITAGALQDYDRALIAGTRTYGKGLVQQTHPLPYDGILKLTTSKYYIPSGRCIQAYKYKNGRPVHIPDSLAKAFHTKSGRTVYDGGGITPDLIIKADSLPMLLSDIALSDQLNDFCSDYVLRHPHIAAPDSFQLTEQDYHDFTAYLKKHHFSYDSRSKEVLKVLREVAKAEGYSQVASPEINALEKKMVHNFDHDFNYWKNEIRQLLTSQIIKRYYYGRGETQYLLRHDKVLQKCLLHIANKEK